MEMLQLKIFYIYFSLLFWETFLYIVFELHIYN